MTLNCLDVTVHKFTGLLCRHRQTVSQQ